MVFFQRPGGRGYPEAMMQLKAYGCKIWVDHDDDLFHIPTDNKTYMSIAAEDYQKSVVRCLKTADVVTVSTDALKEAVKLTTFDTPIVTIPNAIDFRWWDPVITKRWPKRKQVNWRGLDSHHRDLELIARPMHDLYVEHTDWTFGFFGWNPYFITDHMEQNRFSLYKTPIFAYHQELTASGGCVGVVPLRDSDFNRAKSNIAWMELSLSGHGVVASPLHEFIAPGIQNFHSDQEFIEKVEYMMEHYEKHVKDSVAWIESMYNLKNWNKKRVGILETLVKQ